MITKNMQLLSTSDARQWASEFGLENDAQEDLLAAYIWANKPEAGCTHQEWDEANPLTDKEFWAIVEP